MRENATGKALPISERIHLHQFFYRTISMNKVVYLDTRRRRTPPIATADVGLNGNTSDLEATVDALERRRAIEQSIADWQPRLSYASCN